MRLFQKKCLYKIFTDFRTLRALALKEAGRRRLNSPARCASTRFRDKIHQMLRLAKSTRRLMSCPADWPSRRPKERALAVWSGKSEWRSDAMTGRLEFGWRPCREIIFPSSHIFLSYEHLLHLTRDLCELFSLFRLWSIFCIFSVFMKFLWSISSKRSPLQQFQWKFFGVFGVFLQAPTLLDISCKHPAKNRIGRWEPVCPAREHCLVLMSANNIGRPATEWLKDKRVIIPVINNENILAVFGSTTVPTQWLSGVHCKCSRCGASSVY